MPSLDLHRLRNVTLHNNVSSVDEFKLLALSLFSRIVVRPLFNLSYQVLTFRVSAVRLPDAGSARMMHEFT